MDWQGQKHAKFLMKAMLLVFAMVVFGMGYALGSFQIVLLVYDAGLLLTVLVTVPYWPFFNCYALKWLNLEADCHPRPQASTVPLRNKRSKNK